MALIVIADIELLEGSFDDLGPGRVLVREDDDRDYMYRFLAALARLTVRSGRSKDLEIVVRHHQPTMLRCQIDRPELTDDDRSFLGAIASALPRQLRQGWLVTPDALLRWH